MSATETDTNPTGGDANTSSFGLGCQDGAWVTISSGSSTLDNRANALANALNKTGVQSLNNVCTPAAWYLTSAALGAGGAAVVNAPAAVATASQEYPSLINRLLIWAGRFVPRGTIAATVAVIKAAPANIQSACSQLQ